MRKISIGIGISLLFFIGLAGQASARQIHCWDLNENYLFDLETEDINNDGKCNNLDCPEEPSEVIQRLEVIQQTLDFEVIPKLDKCCGYGVPQTGQTSCWDAEGSPIDCEGSGQDGESQRGIVWPDPRFTDNGNGTVTDNMIGLIWLKNANCIGLRFWQSALDDCNDLADGQCGLSDRSSPGDWHLPNVRELHSLVDYGMSQPAFPSPHPFENVQSYDYWSSTYITGNTIGAAWSVSFFQGDVNSTGTHSNTCYVWPVCRGN